VFARGLLKNWKVPVYFAIDQTMTRNILDEVTLAMEQLKFIVRGASFDLGNTHFVSNVGELQGQHCYPNPADHSREFYLVPDPPHLLKLLRNHLFKKGFFFTFSKIYHENGFV